MISFNSIDLDKNLEKIENEVSIASILEFNEKMDKMKDFSQEKRIILKSLEDKYRNLKAQLFNKTYKLSNPENQWISQQEISDFENRLSTKMTLKEYETNINYFDNWLYDLRMTQFMRLFEYKVESDLEDYFAKKNILMCKYIRKIAFDEALKKYNGITNTSYKLKHIDFKRDFPQKELSTFVYLSIDPIDLITFNKVNMVITPDGDKTKICEVSQIVNKYVLNLSHRGQNLKLKVPLYIGAITTKKVK